MTTNPFGNPNYQTTRKFLCCLHNRSDKTHLLLNGLTPTEVYDQLGFEATEENLKTQTINQLVTGCEQNGYIERVGNTGKIRMTADGFKLCNHTEDDGTSYCSKVSSYKD
jgi:hypothetical protein